ncbi:MAG: hypothetical protein DRP00_05465 [Candidatus Aenigmatarchaeota archaeon]|nr:MAG: hypothetical protein DRP00_05465 [Candidatus Aenigmarchaeota archaeon]
MSKGRQKVTREGLRGLGTETVMSTFLLIMVLVVWIFSLMAVLQLYTQNVDMQGRIEELEEKVTKLEMETIRLRTEILSHEREANILAAQACEALGGRVSVNKEERSKEEVYCRWMAGVDSKFGTEGYSFPTPGYYLTR